MKHELPTQDELVRSAVAGLTATKDMEDEAGMCWKHTRLRLAAAGVPASLIPPVGVDASGAARWYRKNHPELIARNGSVPGDVLFFEIGHGEHGHVGQRVPGNRLAENSVAHAPLGKKDGRGTRSLLKVGKPSLVVRFFEA